MSTLSIRLDENQVQVEILDFNRKLLNSRVRFDHDSGFQWADPFLERLNRKLVNKWISTRILPQSDPFLTQIPGNTDLEMGQAPMGQVRSGQHCVRSDTTDLIVIFENCWIAEKVYRYFSTLSL